MDDIEKSSKIAYSALAVFRKWCDSLTAGNITMTELHKYETQHIEEYCKAANSGTKKYCPNYSQISFSVELCHRKFKYVKDCCDKLETIVDYCSNISASECTCIWLHRSSAII